ncbi:MAG: polysulfide reductase NrfD [Proteobacteria bacterium]|nr:polysulfide reductase NrfD [Pseudomonadota bacterium]
MQHTRRQWMVSHEWMVKPMQQTDWIQREGLLIWLTEVFGSLGTGLYLVSIFVNNWWGALAGWLIVMAIKLPIHLIYLGKPTRFWRALPPFTKAWRTSWIARGFFFTILFAGFGFIQLLIGYILMSTGQSTGISTATLHNLDIAFRILGGFGAILTAIYTGFMMSFCKSVPFWNTGLLPIVIINAGIADGLALLIGIGLFTAGVDIIMLESVTRILLLVNILLIATYLLNSTYRSETAGFSSKQLLAGKVAIPFWLGVIILGILIPLVVSLAGYFIGDIGHAALIGAIIAHTIGAFALKYCILKVGIYQPLLSNGSEK